MVWGSDTRSLSLPAPLILPLPPDAPRGIFARALLLGDVDGDGYNEIVYGTPNGLLFIFKDDALAATHTVSGTITCMAVGDAGNGSGARLVVLLAEGGCLLLRFAAHPDSTAAAPRLRVETVGVVSISVNAKSVAIGDVDGDGMQELVVGRTDRVVEIYRLTPDDMGRQRATTVDSGMAGEGPWHVLTPETIAVPAAVPENASQAKDGSTPLNVPSAAETPATSTATAPTVTRQGATADGMYPAVSIKAEGFTAQLLRTYHLDGQVGGLLIAPGVNDGGYASIVASQPAGNLQCLSVKHAALPPRIKSSLAMPAEADLSHSGAASCVVPALGGNMGVCSTAGMVSLYDPVQGKMLWETHVYRTLFAGGALPAAPGKPEEVVLVLCSWDGSTFFFDREGHSVQFSLQEEVSAFAVGEYGRERLPTLVYACMGEGLRVFTNVDVPSVEAVNHLAIVNEHFAAPGRPPLSALDVSALLYAPPPAEEDEATAARDEEQRGEPA